MIDVLVVAGALGVFALAFVGLALWLDRTNRINAGRRAAVRVGTRIAEPCESDVMAQLRKRMR